MTAPLHLFERFGIELEYMIVDAETLSVSPLADRLLEAAVGEPASDFEMGEISWSNELATHVIEVKTTAPAPTLLGLADSFLNSVTRINELLATWKACLLPSAMHPWMDPLREMKLWPLENSEVYASFNRVFDCRGHGWSNLQSIHVNLPFADDQEFGRLHAAIRLILPILPALAASSPVMDGKSTGLLDNRLEVYRKNSRKIPSVAGRVIPEPVFTKADYDRDIFQRIYADIAPHDPDGVLQHEWLNARGAIARFDRGAIEIRVLDVQECPAADLAIVTSIVAVLQSLVAERWTPLAAQQAWPIEPLESIFLSTIRDADRAPISDREYLASFGYPGVSCTTGDLWAHLIQTHRTPGSALEANGRPLDVILRDGPLSRRILTALAGDPSPASLRRVYGRLSACLAQGESFGR